MDFYALGQQHAMEKFAGASLYTYVPTAAVESILEGSLHSGKSLLGDDAALAAAAKGRGISTKEMRSDIQKNLKTWKRQSSLGPNFVFHPIPEGQELSAKHPTRKNKLTLLKLDLEALRAAEPRTKMYGMELKPYDAKTSKPGERHHFIGASTEQKLLDMSPKEYWGKYNDVEDRGLYAPDVPHVALHTPSGAVLGKYLRRLP